MSKPDKKLFLLDAMALIYRAHFAFSKNPRITSKGLNTGSVFGFTNSLIEILTKEKPTHIGVAFDTAAPTFRHTAFEAYKAQRQEQPEDIKVGIPLVCDIVQGFNIPVLKLDGFEADDIIGTFAKKAAEQGFEVFMMTPDKDFGQCVREHVYLYKPSYMGNSVEILGVNEVLARWDIETVDQVRDILGLQGDAVDNIPGIPGVGPKTASKLIQEFGSVENLIANADSLKGKLKENVVQFGAQGILSKQLATIDTEVPLEFNEELLKYTGPNEEKLKALFDELEFRTIKKRLFGDEAVLETVKAPAPSKAKASTGQISLFGEDGSVAVATEVTGEAAQKNFDTIDTVVNNYNTIDTPELRKTLIYYLSIQDEFCFDTETTGVDPIESDIVGLSFSYFEKEAYYVPIPHDKEQAVEILNEFKPVFENERITKVGQNLKFDIMVLSKYGVEVKGPFFDTMLAHYLIEPDMRHSMDVLAESYLNYTPIPIEALIGKGVKQGNMKDVELERISDYAAEDADVTLQLKKILAPIIVTNKLEKIFNDIETPLLNVLADMECSGVRIDVPALKDYSTELERMSRETEEKIFKNAGCSFNIASPLQLGRILFETLKLDPKAKKTKTGQYATGEEVLIKLAYQHDIAKQILEFRELQKLKSTYVDALPTMISPKDGRVHTCYNQAVAATGRLSSTNPNLQNIPIRTEKGREIRRAFVPRDDDHVLLSADYSQIELRIMASLSKDETMIEAFRLGKDIHTATASKIFKVAPEEVDSDMRRKAKTANFGIIYGISPFGLSQRLDIPRREAAEIIDAYFTEFPAVKRYMDFVINEARENHYVETILGRRRYLRDINSRNITMRGYAERNAINAPIQGSAADMIKLAMINIHTWMKKEKLKSQMILQVHDELIFDTHRSETELLKQKIEHFMKEAMPLEVPLEVGLGTGINWLEAH
ncbi:MAG TPA: DNA polymerase I [Cytophagales bacterium]|nr:DNA polymerase I [Cytophagales bacterium]